MSGVYSVEDLLKLRASPLICKPAGLPPAEDWMGTQEPTARRPATRGKQEDSSNAQSETFQKRPAPLDGQPRRTAADPERIILGPPRRSFASSNARAGGKLQEGVEDSVITKDRTSFHDRGRNIEGEGRNQEKRGPHHANGRFNSRQEGDDPETDHRRDYDRKPKWASRSDAVELEDDLNDDSSRTGFRREVHSRAKLSQSWFKRDGDPQDDVRKDHDRAREWRRGERLRDRDWDSSNRVEADPEWMDAPEPEEPSQVHTQEDFQRWKERMKAGNAAAAEKPDVDISQVMEKPAETLAKPVRVASPENDDSMDKFFARFNEPKKEAVAGPAKPATKSKFASLFSPAVEQQKQVESAAPALPAESPLSPQQSSPTTDADQAGFARILEMLQTRSNNPTPHTQDGNKPKTPLYAREPHPRPGPEQRPSSDIMSLFSQESPQQHAPPRLPHNHERFAGSRSPVEQQTHNRQQASINKDEVLLNLLRQASLAPKPQPPQHSVQSEVRSAAAMYGMPPEAQHMSSSRNQMISPVLGPDPTMHSRRENGRPMYDESPVAMYQSEPQSREPLTRRPTNGMPMEDPLLSLLRGQRPGQPPPGPAPPQAFPPGLSRPPGLDGPPRQQPNWLPQQPQPPQPARQTSIPPPGLPNIPRGAPGPFSLPNQQAQQTNMQQQGRPQQQRKYTGESAIPNFPPGMGPPPGFMNAGPPPGFPGYGQRFQAENPQNRAFMEMYGRDGVGLRGGTGNGGGYR